MSILRTIACIVLSAVGTGSAADLVVSPSVLDTDVSNITTSFSISTSNAGNVAWVATRFFDGQPSWFVLSAYSGTVSLTSENAIPLTVRRDRIPSIGTYTALVVVTGGDIARTVTVMTAISSTQNGMFPQIGGDDHAYAGRPYQLDARFSVGWIGSYQWITNYNPGKKLVIQPINTNPTDEVVFGVPDEFTLTLYTKDAHDRSQSDSKRFRVFNSPPSVNANGPYYARVGDTVTVVATGIDPSPSEQLVYAWQFEPPGGPFTPLSPSPTASYVYAHLYNSYIVCVVSDTWTGAAGTYNAPLGGDGIARMVVTNQPPMVQVAYQTNGFQSAWSNRHDVATMELPTTGLVLCATLSADTGAVLSVEWREDPANPAHDVLPAAEATNLQVAIARLPEPGVYHFSLVGADRGSFGTPAVVAVSVPGVKCNVVVEGFQSKLPVWGTFSSINAANTNAFGIHDETETTRSDMDGWFYLDRAANAQSFVELERYSGERQSYVFTPALSSENRLRQQLFHFPLTLHAYSGRIRGGSNAFITMVVHPGIRVPSTCNSDGLYSFGDLPKSLPIDTSTGDFHFIVLKEGYKSLCIVKSGSSPFGLPLKDVYDLAVSTSAISVGGVVLSSLSATPISNAHVWFGSREAITLQNGQFMFSNLPQPQSPSVRPSHVLVVEAPGYPRTRAVFYNTVTGGFVTISLDEQTRYVHGTLYDAETKSVVTNGTVEVPGPGGLSMKAVVSVPVSLAGYFMIPVPAGIAEIVVNANGMSQHVPAPNRGLQPAQVDVQLMPEPASVFVGAALAFALRRRNPICRG